MKLHWALILLAIGAFVGHWLTMHAF